MTESDKLESGDSYLSKEPEQPPQSLDWADMVEEEEEEREKKIEQMQREVAVAARKKEEEQRTRSEKRKKPGYEYERDKEVLARRQKQIDFGKNTSVYDTYLQAVPRQKREKHHPQTPPRQKKMSRRAWDGSVKVWKRQLHEWAASEGHSGTPRTSRSASSLGTDDADSMGTGSRTLSECSLSPPAKQHASRSLCDDTDQPVIRKRRLQECNQAGPPDTDEFPSLPSQAKDGHAENKSLAPPAKTPPSKWSARGHAEKNSEEAPLPSTWDSLKSRKRASQN